jgi:hypothetical protein
MADTNNNGGHTGAQAQAQQESGFHVIGQYI